MNRVGECDQELLRQMEKGNEDALVTVYRRYHGQIYRYALHMTGSKWIAEDVTRQVFLDLIGDLRKFSSARAPLQLLLLRNGCNCVARCFERRSDDVHQMVSESEGTTRASNGDAPSAIGPPEQIAPVRTAILKLPVLYREVVVLCDLEGRSHSEAAEILPCPIRDVRSRLRNARGLLLGELAAWRLRLIESQV
jgi:RNA polymerase sigma-70 factor (ECF subfamily)